MTKTLTRKQKQREFAEDGYNITVTGRHLHVTDAMKAYAFEKLSKLERFTNRIIDITLVMDIQKMMHRVDIHMKFGHTLITSHAETTDMYVSVDQAVNKLETQLTKYNRRLKNHHAKSHPVVDIPVTVYSPLTEEQVIDEHEVNDEIEVVSSREYDARFSSHKIVKVESQPLKILTDDEAVMNMELSGHKALVFRDEVTRKLKVIYRRDDGNYSVIQPE
jgi:putative sigma-54 modulation protein